MYDASTILRKHGRILCSYTRIGYFGILFTRRYHHVYCCMFQVQWKSRPIRKALLSHQVNGLSCGDFSEIPNTAQLQDLLIGFLNDDGVMYNYTMHTGIHICTNGAFLLFSCIAVVQKQNNCNICLSGYLYLEYILFCSSPFHWNDYRFGGAYPGSVVCPLHWLHLSEKVRHGISVRL